MSDKVLSSVPMKTVKVAAAVIIEKARVFAVQRGYGEYKDWWEFPGGKVEAGETSDVTIVREIREELETLVSADRLLCTVEYDYPAFHLSMDCYLCTVVEGALTLMEHEAARWLGKDELYDVRWLPADVTAVNLVKDMLH
ncbi:MAG: (deoxy)nucleoside triphosphate pyrophosphohydrolase [Bullifex sp.]